ncbi:nucleotidyl transferase AbiEii/AbiGii toxin family protein [Acuticoccus yangtzensis]|uniref:nucleotidyl transferase AbiEii/AbiGii toxin family protein n=1 Tax=Acuticoccus yangtzensis TaxID=1443441 RepID=UPI00196B0321|nr:nucleotidyl transferase AbiEii/AbiGii toxin family protein [Acuticoccus yangtzensis]
MLDDVGEISSVVVDLSEWVQRVRSDPEAYLERQATELFLAALGMAHPYCKKVFLKGGILMGVVYGSTRQTADIDFSTSIEPTAQIADELRSALTAALPRAAAELGYADLVCRVQSLKHRPRPDSFVEADGPAIEIRIAYAERGSRQEKHVHAGTSSKVLYADISFKEPVGAVQIVRFADADSEIRAYSLYDLIAEKLRALLQQEVRNRYRRQDIYDIDLLLSQFDLSEGERRTILELLSVKCAARKITPEPASLANPEIKRRAGEDWESLGLEIGHVPDFEACFQRVRTFYETLPW